MVTESQQNALQWLGQADLRPTQQRRVLAELLIGDGQDRHVTAESLHAASRQVAHVSLATVYNTLRLFCDVGLMSEIIVDGQKSYFDTCTDDHPHFYWEDEGYLTDAPKDSVQINQMPDPPEGSEISRVDVVIRLRKI